MYSCDPLYSSVLAVLEANTALHHFTTAMTTKTDFPLKYLRVAAGSYWSKFCCARSHWSEAGGASSYWSMGWRDGLPLAGEAAEAGAAFVIIWRGEPNVMSVV